MKLNINGNAVDLDIEAFNKAIEDKQESFEIKSDAFVMRSTDNQALYEENLKKEYGDHKVEIGRKEVLNALGIETEGKGLHKSADKSLGAINDFINQSTKTALDEAGKAPDGKIKELTTDLETLRGNLLAKDTELESSRGEFTAYKNQATVNSGLSTELGKFKDINNNENRLLIFNSKQKTGLDENGVVRGYNQDGSVMKDSNLNPLGLDQVVTKYYESNPDNLMKVEGGAGGSDSTGADGKIKFDDFVKQQSSIGNTPSSVEFKQEAARLQSTGNLDLS